MSQITVVGVTEQQQFSCNHFLYNTGPDPDFLLILAFMAFSCCCTVFFDLSVLLSYGTTVKKFGQRKMYAQLRLLSHGQRLFPLLHATK